MSNLYTVYFGLTASHIAIQKYLTDCAIHFRTYYAPGVNGARVIYNIDSDIEFLSVLLLKFSQAELISTVKGVER